MQPLILDDNALWKKRFRAPAIAGTQIASRNPERGLVVSNRSGIYQLYGWDVATGMLHQATDAPAGVIFGGISPDGAYIIYLSDAQGNEIGHFVRVPFEGGGGIAAEAEDMTPDMPLYASFSFSASLSGNLFGFTAAGAKGFELYTIAQGADKSLDQPQLLYRSERMSIGPLMSFDGDYAVVATTERSQNLDMALLGFHLQSVDGQYKVKVLQEADGSIQPTAFAPVAGDTRVLATTNMTGSERPIIWDVKTGDRIDIPLDDLAGDVRAYAWSPDGTRILLLETYQAVQQFYVYDLAKSVLTKLKHPSGTVSSAYFVPGTDEIYATMQDSEHPTRVVALDGYTGEQKRIVLSPSDAPAGRPWRSVMFTSSEGAQIQAWLAVPEGKGPFPTILHTHGGPTAVQAELYDAGAQTWLDHGFAWMSVNYRGSTTFGRDFERAIWGNLGMREVDDMAAAYRWLVDNGIAQPDSVLLTGGSYGGYLTLQALGRRPDLWAGGMATVAIADWTLLYEDEAETLRGYQRSIFGGTPDELPEQHAKSSPITYAGDIRAPVMVIQGENDTRCPSRQMKVYEQKLKSLGKEVEVHWFEAGHGSRAIEQNIDHMELRLRFAYRVLG